MVSGTCNGLREPLCRPFCTISSPAHTGAGPRFFPLASMRLPSLMSGQICRWPFLPHAIPMLDEYRQESTVELRKAKSWGRISKMERGLAVKIAKIVKMVRRKCISQSLISLTETCGGSVLLKEVRSFGFLFRAVGAFAGLAGYNLLNQRSVCLRAIAVHPTTRDFHHLMKSKVMKSMSRRAFLGASLVGAAAGSYLVIDRFARSPENVSGAATHGPDTLFLTWQRRSDDYHDRAMDRNRC